VPPLLVRVLFVLLAIFFGTSVVVYLLLWALVPMAGSTTEKLQMRGRPVTLAAIDQGVRDGLAPIPEAARNVAAQGITAVGSLIRLVVVAIARALKWVAGTFVVGVATAGLLFFTVSLVVALVNASAPPLHPDGAEFFANFGAWEQVFKVSAYLVLAIPLAVIIATALRLFWGFTRLNSRGLAGLLGVWVISLLGTAAIWSGNYSQVRQYIDEHPAIEQARRALEAYSAMVATTSPLSDDQSAALLATLTAEQKRRQEEYRLRAYPWRDQQAQLAFEAETIEATELRNRRVIESASAYLDEQQLAVIQDSMTRNVDSARSRLQARVERLEQRAP